MYSINRRDPNHNSLLANFHLGFSGYLTVTFAVVTGGCSIFSKNFIIADSC